MRLYQKDERVLSVNLQIGGPVLPLKGSVTAPSIFPPFLSSRINMAFSRLKNCFWLWGFRLRLYSTRMEGTWPASSRLSCRLATKRLQQNDSVRASGLQVYRSDCIIGRRGVALSSSVFALSAFLLLFFSYYSVIYSCLLPTSHWPFFVSLHSSLV
jgi:hypothetical protein